MNVEGTYNSAHLQLDGFKKIIRECKGRFRQQ